MACSPLHAAAPPPPGNGSATARAAPPVSAIPGRERTPEVGRVLDKALAGGEVSIEEGTLLLDAGGADLPALFAAADELRRRAVGDAVTYVVNRNINFTNVCVKRCGFCAFSRGHKAAEGYFLPTEEVVRRAREAFELGATEVCVQAGLAPGLDGWHYVNTCRALTDEIGRAHV